MPTRSEAVKTAGADTRPGWRVWVQRLAPWVITAAVVALLLRQYPIGEIALRLREGRAWPMVPWALVATCGMLFVIALCDTLVMRGVLGRPGYWDVVRGKAGTSMLMTLGYGFGHGGYAVWIARATRATIAETASVALYISASDLTALSIVATVAVYLGGAEVPAMLRWLPPAIAAGMLALAMIAPYRLLPRTPAVFEAWPRMPRLYAVATIAGRAVNLTGLMLLTWAAARGFGMPIPLSAVLVYLPVIFLVGSLPINIAGFGVVQGVWVLFFEPYAPGAQILAFQFLWHVMNAGGLVLRGAPFLRRVVGEIGEGRLRSAATPASAPPAPPAAD